MQRLPVPSMSGLFGAAVEGRLEMARLSKATLTELSHVLENMILEFDLPATVLTGFQTTRNWTSELARYERLVQPQGRSVAVFASGNLGDTGSVLGFEVAEDSPLTQEWFIIVLTDQFSAALFGEDNPDDVPPYEEMDRVFDAAWTFDPQLVGELCDVLVAEVRRGHPERTQSVVDSIADHSPRTAQPLFEQRFNRRVFEAMEAGRWRWRRELVRAHDIHDRLQRANEELLRLERLAAIGTTAATLAHELNNPLASITMTAELMAMRADDSSLSAANVQHWATSIVQMAARAGKMTRGILDLARVHEATIEPVRLDTWLNRFAEEMSTATRRIVAASCPTDTIVLVDDDRLRHVLTNLVNNGLQASDPGSPVTLSVEVGALDVALAVTDHGEGIPAAVTANLFQPFTTTRSGQGGTGLGLALAQRFAEDQRCRLDLTTTGPDGTVFTLTIPLAEPTAESEPVAVDAAPTPNGERRVLVIDDDADVRALLGHLLRQSGWQVTTASDVNEAVEAVTATPFDAVLVDFRLADGNSAVDALTQLEAARAGIRDRAVVITGSLARELPKELPPILLKPFSRSELEAAITARLHTAGG